MGFKDFGQVLLAILFLVYLIVGYKITPVLAVMINNLFAKVVIVLLVALLFLNFHPILGILGMFIAFQIIHQSMNYRSSYAPGLFGANLKSAYPTEKIERSNLSLYNQFPYTLEQEIVKKMSPLYKYDSYTNNTYGFKPVLDDNYNASFVNQQTDLLHGVPKLQHS
jgi:hypothetical protein